MTWTTAVSCCTRCDGPWPSAQTLLSSCATTALRPDVALLAAVQSATTRWAAALEWLRVAKVLQVEINATKLHADLLDLMNLLVSLETVGPLSMESDGAIHHTKARAGRI